MSSSNISTEGAVQIDQDEPLVLDIVHSTISDTCENSLDVEKSTSNETLSTSYLKTSLKGPLLNTVKPSWMKTAECEQRLAWLKTMWNRKLCLRELESYSKALSAQLRTDEMRVREEERKVLLDLMLVKIRDEKRNLQILEGVREEVRDWLRNELGRRRRFETLMVCLGRDVKRKKMSLKKKYNEKVTHLEKERKSYWKRKTIELKYQKICRSLINVWLFMKVNIME